MKPGLTGAGMLPRAFLVGLLLVTGAAAAEPDASSNAERSLTPDRVLASLTKTLAWYREARVAMRGAGTVFGREDEQTALAVVRRAFETARAQAAAIAAESSSAASAQPTDAGPQAGKLVQMKATIQTDEQEVQRLRRQLRTVPPASRPGVRDALAAATNRLELDRVRFDFLSKLAEDKVSSSDAGLDLGHEIQTLQESVPELRSASDATPAATPPASGTTGLVRHLIGVYRVRGSLDHLTQSTRALERSIGDDLHATQASLRPIMSQLRALTADPSPGGSLAEGQRSFRNLLQQGKALGAVALSLREESALVHRFAGDLDGWKGTVDRDRWQILQNLGIDLVGVVIVLAALLVGGVLLRVATVRYVQDTYRRRLLLMGRNVVVGTAMALVLVFHFASELTALVTGLGFAAAGIAFALQNVILSLAGYFSMVAPNGIRVGDRVSLQGPFGYVQGEVLEIGFVRIRLRELDGAPLHPTGRTVVFPNSVVFTGSFFKHPPSGDRGEGPRSVERSAAA
jgi:hypothetical protein